MARNLDAEPLLPIDDLQADALAELVKKREHLLFFSIVDDEAFRAFLRDLDLTTVRQCLDQRALIAARRAAGITTLVPTPGLNVAFSFAGLVKLGQVQTGTAGLELFEAGMAASRATLSDPDPASWDILGPGRRPDGVFIVTGASEAEVSNTIALRLAPTRGQGFTVLHEERGQVRPDPVSGHEHFGYADGVSQPGVRGRVAPGVALHETTSPDPDQAAPGQDLLWTGEFVLGFPGQDPDATVATEGPEVAAPVPFMQHGSFLVFRRLAQKVPEFDLAAKRAARMASSATDPVSADLFGAQMVGRWKSGAPVIRAPLADDPKIDESVPLLVNDFEFSEDVDGLVCPFAAHVRKVYPRDDITPGAVSTEVAEARVQTHRMMRRGITFGPELTDAEARSGSSDPYRRRGLLFLCYVTSLAEQFEFVQRFWVDNADFLRDGSGVDAIIGQPAGTPLPFRGAAATSHDATQTPVVTFERFVEMQGGEYFFAPSVAAVRGL